jgi:hypothetical protein
MILLEIAAKLETDIYRGRNYYSDQIYYFLISSKILDPNPFERPNGDDVVRMYNDFLRQLHRIQ